MTNTHLKKTGAYLQSGDRSLQFLLEKAKTLEAIQQQLAPCLDPAYRPYCQVGNLTNQRLTLIVANGAIATQIRFQSADLLRKFKENPLLKNIQSIQCKVRPDNPATRQNRQSRSNIKPMQQLSTQTAQLMHEIADSMDDPALKEIMQRIAKNRSKK